MSFFDKFHKDEMNCNLAKMSLIKVANNCVDILFLVKRIKTPFFFILESLYIFIKMNLHAKATYLNSWDCFDKLSLCFDTKMHYFYFFEEKIC